MNQVMVKLPKWGRAVTQYASLTLALSKLKVLLFLVGPYTACWNAAKVESTFALLKSTDMIMNASGCCVCRLAVTE